MLKTAKTALLALCLALPAQTAHAQMTPQSFATTAYALDGGTLYGGGRTIALWGLDIVHPAGTPEHLRARAALDELVGESPIRCIPQGALQANRPVLAQCLNAQERDIALTLIANGIAAADRRQIADTELSGPYLQAERQARTANLGIWGTSQTAQAATPAPDQSGSPRQGMPTWLLLIALIGLPLAGFSVIAVILRRGFRELVTLQKYQIAGTQKRERELKAREKHVIAAAIEAEINTNRAKLDAYLIIYEELLKSLRDPTKTPKYQRAGDIIHDKPALTRTVYDSNLDKLDLLGPDITNKLSVLYQSIDPNPDYRTLEPEMPIEKVWEMVERIIRNAEKMVEPMDQLVGALNVIVRDRRGPGSAA